MSAPNTLLEDRARIFDSQGFEGPQISAPVARSWSIGEEGRAEFSVPLRNTAIANDTVLRYGNWLLVENNHLPPWVGVIDTPRTFNADSVTVSAYTPEHVFGWRRGPLEQNWEGRPGRIFELLLNLVNIAQNTIIKTGYIAPSSTAIVMTVNPKSLNTYLADLLSISGEEYSFTPSVKDGALSVQANWSQMVGVSTSLVLLVGKRGGNVEMQDGIVVEDGPIVNDFLGFGAGATWTSKITSNFTNSESIQKYTLRQYAGEFQTGNTATLQNSAWVFLDKYREPDRAFALNALNIGSTFDYLDIGNRMTFIRETSADFWNMPPVTVRIVGMGYNPIDGAKVSLVVKQVTE